MSAVVLRGDAAHLPLPDASVDLIVTSPPYFGLRSYTDAGEHYDGQIGSEASPAEWVAALVACTAEWVRVLKPSGSIFVNLGDAFSSGQRYDNEFTIEDAAWLAGVIDSDGSISIHKQGTSYTAWVRVGQMRPEVVKRIESVTGTGTVCEDKRGCWHWQAAAQQASAVLTRIWPWLHIKRRQAYAAVELQERKAAVGGKGRWNALTDDELRHRERIRQAVLTWNAGEADDYEPPLLPLPDLPPRARWIQAKSLMGLPWRYALAVQDELGLILRRDIIWAKPNGLPESVTDRCRSSHEYLFHFTVRPRYYAAVDEIREGYSPAPKGKHDIGSVNAFKAMEVVAAGDGRAQRNDMLAVRPAPNPLGKLPGSVWEIPSQPLSVPTHLGVDHFACVDTETEILTRRGWLRHHELRDDDEVAGSDLDSGLTRWTRLHGIHRYDFDGELVTAEARGLSMRLTPNHRVLAHRYAGRHRFRQPLEVITADTLTAKHSIPRAVQWAEDGREKSIGTDLAALLGWVAAEGWYSADRRRVYLSQSATVNAAKVGSIAALLARLGDDPLRTERDRDWRGRSWHDVQWRLGRVLGAEVLRLMPGKLLPARVADLPLTEARALLDAFIDGDGHRRADGRLSVFQQERHNLDVLQAVAVRLGYNTTLRPNGGRWVLYLNPPRPARLRRSDGTSLVGREHYRGVVWCVTTGTGTFVARRNGAVFVTGNSFPMELPRRCILGWSPPGICVECGEGRRPVAVTTKHPVQKVYNGTRTARRAELGKAGEGLSSPSPFPATTTAVITGYACACPDATAPTRPAVVVDPFGGTGTTALVASMLGRTGVSVDLSADYCRLARWRTTDPAERAKALQVPKPPPVPDGQVSLFDEAS